MLKTKLADCARNLETARVKARAFNRYDKNGDGVLGADEMALRSAAKQKAASDVRGMDADGDGVVDQGEFMAGGGTKQEFDKYDANGDGVLDVLELEHRAPDSLQARLAKAVRERSQASREKQPSNRYTGSAWTDFKEMLEMDKMGAYAQSKPVVTDRYANYENSVHHEGP